MQEEQGGAVQQEKSKRAQVLIGGATLALGAFYLFEAQEHPLGSLQMPGAGAFPSLVALGLLAVGALIVMTALLGRNLPENVESDAPGRRRVLLLMAVLVLYVIGLVTIGFTVSSVVAVYAMVHILRSTLDVRGRVVYSVLLVVATELLFSGLFQIRFPGGFVGLLT
jgi:hypothetical protein